MKAISIRRVLWGVPVCVVSLMSNAYAATPADAPAGSTGLCKDGSYSQAAAKRGACAGHKGVKDWYGAAAASAPMTGDTAAAMVKTAPTGAGPSVAAVATAAAPGGAPGSVWANQESKVYHCGGSKWYGKTKNGAYMSEADAKAKGFHADHGKACS